MTAPDDVLVGVDGGATHTRLLVATRGGESLARLEAPGSLVRPAHPEAGVARLAEHVRNALHGAGRLPPAYALCCALAGAGRPETQQRVEGALRDQGLATHVRVIPDVDAAFQDAFSGGDGILLLAGTGSIAVACNGGRTARAGGWGAVFGDEGSAYAIGRAALAAAARAHDGRGAATRLTNAVLRDTGCATPEALIAWADGAGKAHIAALAPLVLKASTDPVASSILDHATEHHLLHVRALLNRLGPWKEPPRLAFAGGILAPDSPLREMLMRRLQAGSVPVIPLDTSVDAARGALRLAADL